LSKPEVSDENCTISINEIQGKAFIQNMSENSIHLNDKLIPKQTAGIQLNYGNILTVNERVFRLEYILSLTSINNDSSFGTINILKNVAESLFKVKLIKDYKTKQNVQHKLTKACLISIND
jgi:hypothetical protein